MRHRLAVSLVVLLLVLAGCANKPRFETTGVDTDTTPQAAARDLGSVQGREVLWGGVIVSTSNLSDATQIEVLAYPLDKRQRPITERGPTGRFIARKPGYLESADYAPGRLITVRGQVEESLVGKVGDASYTYPVIDLADSQLWDREPSGSEFSRPRVNFGIGVMIGR